MDRLADTRSRIVLVGIVALLVSSFLLAACGGSDDSDDEGAMERSMSDGDAALVEPAMDMEEEAAGEAYAIDPASASTGEVAQDAPPQAQQIALDRLVIRTATITLTVENTLDATASVRNIAAGKGGFVFSSTTYSEDERQYAQLTLRVPATSFDDTISELRGAPWVTDPRGELFAGRLRRIC